MRLLKLLIAIISDFRNYSDLITSLYKGSEENFNKQKRTFNIDKKKFLLLLWTPELTQDEKNDRSSL